MIYIIRNLYVCNEFCNSIFVKKNYQLKNERLFVIGFPLLNCNLLKINNTYLILI